MTISVENKDGKVVNIDLADMLERLEKVESQAKIAVAGMEFMRVTMEEMMKLVQKALDEIEAQEVKEKE